jgi:hypothetical protein
MGGESAVAIVAGHELLATDGGASGDAGGTLSARDDRRHDDRPALPAGGILARGHHPTGDLVTEDQGKRMAGRNPAEGEADVGVTDTAAGDLDDDLVRAGVEWWKIVAFEGLARSD